METILAGYIEEDRKCSPEEFQKRENTIGELIPMTIAHWGDGWFFLSYPNIHEIVITNNGYYIDLADADYYGQMLFVPWNKDPIEVYSWIQ